MQSTESALAGIHSFLQTKAAQLLKKMVLNDNGLAESDREDLTAFLSGSSSSESPAAVLGVLKQMADRRTADLKEDTDAETEKIQAYDGLIDSKTKEVAALTKSIE